jgi:hypothetical protein
MNDRESKMITLRTDESGKPTVWCDPEIADLVDALNTGDLSTVASCSGHGHRPGRISLKDGRELLVMNSEQADAAERLFGIDINGASQESAPGQEADAINFILADGTHNVVAQRQLPQHAKLYLAPSTSTAIAAMAIKQAAELARESLGGRAGEMLASEILALSPADAEAELEALTKGWKEAAIAWEVCASIHREYAKGKDALFATRQADYARHANEARRVLDEKKGK